MQRSDATNQQLPNWLQQHPEHTLASSSAMEELGLILARHCQPGVTLAIQGPLGAGKTTFVRGLVAGWCGQEQALVASPTFALMHQYGPIERPLLHLDLYRIPDQDPSLLYELAECLHDHRGIAAIEWPELAPKLLPPDTLWLSIEPLGPHQRCLRWHAQAPISPHIESHPQLRHGS